MISFLRGVFLNIEENRVILDINGVGYEVFVPSGVVESLPPFGHEVEVYTYLYVRKEFLQLYGFLSSQERNLFRLLLKIPGVGPRVALTILDVLPGEKLLAVVSEGNLEGLLQVPGIGRKSAQRLLFELKEKLPQYFGEKKREEESAEKPTYEEVFEALLALGYSRQEAGDILNKIKKRKPDAGSSVEILRCALKELGRGKK